MITILPLAQPLSQYNKVNFEKKSNVTNFRGRVCNVEKCRANCCYHVPIPRDILRKFADKIVNPIIAQKSLSYNKKFGGKNVLPYTNMNPNLNKCPFLTLTNKCNIYENRPTLCRLFGTSKRKDFECRHQDITSD